jgi:hypothetical protein
MIGRKGLVGLSLLCALAFCAFGAFGASSASAAGTTAFTCVEEGGEEDFEDEHCDEEVAPGTGEYGHVDITSETSIVATNSLTLENKSSWLLNGTIGGTAVEITCGTVNATGTLKNAVNGNGEMVVEGSGELSTTNCMLMQPAAQTNNCTVTVQNTKSIAGTKEMKMVFSPEPGAGGVFTKITIVDGPGTCPKALKGTFTVEGSAAATGLGSGATPSYSGATMHFTDADTTSTLVFAGHPAGLTGTLTFRMAPVEGVEQNPITLTTE